MRRYSVVLVRRIQEGRVVEDIVAPDAQTARRIALRRSRDLDRRGADETDSVSEWTDGVPVGRTRVDHVEDLGEVR